MHRRSRFLSGRNGPDALSMAISILACILLVVAMFTRGAVSSTLWFLALAVLIISYFRIFSRNLEKRREENDRFLNRIRPVTRFFAQRKHRRQQKNLYCFFKCPQCATVLRVPRGKGHIRITCKCCGHVFERNT